MLPPGLLPPLLFLSPLQNSHQPREVVYTSIATQTVLAGLSLWKGFETGDD